MARQCPGQNRDGSACSAVPLPGNDWCHWHDPSREQIRTETRRLGGHNKSREARAKKLLAAGMQDLGDVRDVLMVAMLECKQKKLDPKILTALATAARASMALSIGEEIEKRIAEMQREAGDLSGRIGA